MHRTHWLGLIIFVLCLTALFGCQQRPVVPTVAPLPTDPVVVIVVTATSQPTLMPTNTVEATITPLPALTPVVTETVTATVRATNVAQATRPPATVAQGPTDAPTEVAPPPTDAPSNFPAPAVFSPEEKAFRDGDTLKLEFASVGPLASDQCYRFDVTLGNPTGPGGVGDYWVGYCGNQSNAGDRLVFEVKPGRFRDEPNYGTLLVSADSVIPPTPQYVMQWFVTVVQKIDETDPIHPNVQPLSPASAALQNIFFH